MWCVTAAIIATFAFGSTYVTFQQIGRRAANTAPAAAAAARTMGTDTVTWQPETGLRMAIVAREAAGKVVVAGQSLAPVEASDRMTLLILAAGWLGSMVVISGALGAATLMDRRAGRVPWRRIGESAG